MFTQLISFGLHSNSILDGQNENCSCADRLFGMNEDIDVCVWEIGIKIHYCSHLVNQY